MIRTLSLVLLCASAPLRLSAQSDLGAIATAAASAWQRHAFGEFVSEGRIQVTLPGGAPSTPVAAEQAEALLRSYVQGAVEVGVSVTNSSLVGGEAAYVELARRFRAEGSQELRTETILLAYRRNRLATPPETGLTTPPDGGWVLTEVRALGGG
jgi:hypothetical protein